MSPTTYGDLAEMHQNKAEELLAYADQVPDFDGRLELDARATAHATLAVSYLLAPDQGAIADDDE